MHEAIDLLIRDWEDEDLYDLLLAEACRRLNPTAAALYAINPAKGNLERVAANRSDESLPKDIPAPPKQAKNDTDRRYVGIVRKALSKVASSSPEGEVRSVTATLNGLTLIGTAYQATLYSCFLVSSDEAVTDRQSHDLAAICELIFAAQQHRQARAALRAQETPIGITGPADQFYREITQYLRDATGMQYIALRERGPADATHRRLRATAVWGWDLPESEFSFEDFGRYEPFELAIANNAETFSPDRNHPGLQQLWEDFPHLAPVQSFSVFPISDGERVSAVLSVASSCRLDFTPTFLSIIAGIARSIGVTLKNRELFYKNYELQTNAFESTVALDATELFSDVVHQIRNQVTEIPGYLDLLTLQLKRKKLKLDAIDSSGPYSDLSNSLDRISDLLHQADDITQPLTPELEQVSVRDTWHRAVALLQTRIDRQGITIRPHGDAHIDAYPILLRQVLFHLILNSLAAFAARRSHEDKRIDLYITQPQGRPEVLLRYVDNAGGIDPSKLRDRGRRGSNGSAKGLEEVIFLRGVTSRPKGTGNGLWIVRQIIQRHRGSIELTKYRGGGVVFDITLPTNLRARLSQRKVL